VSGGLAGLSGWVFLKVLDRITTFRYDHSWLYLLLPVGGLVLGLMYHYLGGRAKGGNPLLIEQIHEPTEWVPKRMAPLILIGTWGSQLVGASVGREGTALQMSGGLTDLFSRAIRLPAEDRRILLIAALAGGFGAVFGVPVAGAVFALEVQSLGRVRYEAIVPALTASVVGNLVVTGLGYHHAVRTHLDPHVNAWLLLRLAAAGILFGLAGAAFVELTDRIKSTMARFVSFPPLRTFIGGAALLGLTALVGHDYLGMSLPLINRALAGDRLSFAVFALKILFTALSIGTLFPGGEVTPLFAIGATLGAALASPLHLSGPLIAAIGFVAVFAGASNAPLACTILGIELFGSGAAVPFAVACVVAYVFSGHRSIYPSQRMSVLKFGGRPAERPRVHDWHQLH
jgi:H+/Cl- antiporter ClcA